MTDAPASPFVIVGDPTAAACEGDFCPAPEVRERVAVPEDQERDPSPADAPTGHLARRVAVTPSRRT